MNNELYKCEKESENPKLNRLKSNKGFSIKMLTYKELLMRDPDPVWARQKIFNHSLTHTLTDTAKLFGCHINTVKKIKKRGHSGEFSNRSRARKHQVNAISESVVEDILTAREDKLMDPLNLKHQYDIPCSVSTVYRTLQRHNKIIPRKRKYKRSKDLRAYKQTYKMFEHVQVDGKQLTDIVEFYPYYKKFELPKWQFTFTCQKSGATFIAYSKSESMLAGMTFITYVFEHLKRYGITTKNIRVKTDQGSYAIGSARSAKQSAFTTLIKDTYESKHYVNRHKNQNADVERFHGLVEEYFYKQTKPKSKSDFFKKAGDTQVWFNYIRKNGGKNWQTPLDFLKKDYPTIDPQVLALSPINLDEHSDLYFYKTDPNYQPLTPDLFFADNHFFAEHPDKLKNFHNEKNLYFGDASKSHDFGHDVVKLDA